MKESASLRCPRTIVVALNPSIDVEWRVQDVVWEEKNSIVSERRWAGGKGINVARWLRHLEGDPLLLLPLGGRTGREMSHYLRAEKLPARIMALAQATRANIIVTTATGRQLRFNPAGPQLSGAEWQRMVRTIARCLRAASPRTAPRLAVAAGKTIEHGREAGASPGRGSCLVLSGSLPQGLRPSAYAQLVWLARRAGMRALLDCDGPALRLGVKAQPFLVKPNGHELEQWWGKRLKTNADLLTAARAMSRITRGWVLVSRGARGAWLVHETAGHCWRVPAPPVKTVNTIGAGDALLAAVAGQVAAGAPPTEWLRWGVAAGTAATTCGAGQLPPLTVVHRLARRMQIV